VFAVKNDGLEIKGNKRVFIRIQIKKYHNGKNNSAEGSGLLRCDAVS
jgi:hypothetical protein